jgi:DNA-binding IclR family transcriptional regulator
MLLRTLAERSYVERDSSELYRINPILRESESGWIGGHVAGLTRRAQPIMRRLSESVRETCLLASLTPDGYVRLLAKVVSPREIRYDTDLSQLNPAHRIASGRVQLAYLGSADLSAYIERWNNSERPAEDWIDEDALQAEIDAIRTMGVALAIDQWEAGATGVSAPIFDAGGRVTAAITVGAVTARFLADRDEIVIATRAAAAEITALDPVSPHPVPKTVRKAAGRVASTKQQKGRSHVNS